MKNNSFDNGEEEQKVEEFINMLGFLEKLYRIPKNSHETLFLRKLRRILNPHKNLNYEDFLKKLDNSLNKKRERVPRKKVKEVKIDIENITYQDLKKLFSKGVLNKEQLLQLGEKRFGLIKGTHKKLSKADIQKLLTSYFENIETLDAIARKASK